MRIPVSQGLRIVHSSIRRSASYIIESSTCPFLNGPFLVYKILGLFSERCDYLGTPLM